MATWHTHSRHKPYEAPAPYTAPPDGPRATKTAGRAGSAELTQRRGDQGSNTGTPSLLLTGAMTTRRGFSLSCWPHWRDGTCAHSGRRLFFRPPPLDALDPFLLYCRGHIETTGQDVGAVDHRLNIRNCDDAPAADDSRFTPTLVSDQPPAPGQSDNVARDRSAARSWNRNAIVSRQRKTARGKYRSPHRKPRPSALTVSECLGSESATARTGRTEQRGTWGRQLP